MKKIIITAVFIYLIFMFLVYSGVFRDNTDPLAVTKYYFECLRNREGFLTYKISASGCFDEDKHGERYKEYKMYNIARIKFKLIEKKDTSAYVQARIIYKDKQVIDAVVELEKNDKAWLIRHVKYN